MLLCALLGLLSGRQRSRAHCAKQEQLADAQLETVILGGLLGAEQHKRECKRVSQDAEIIGKEESLFSSPNGHCVLV